MSSGGKFQPRFYNLKIHMGLCRGPIDSIVAIQVGGRQAWPRAFTDDQGKWTADPTTGAWTFGPGSGASTPDPGPGPITTNGSVKIEARDLFGDDEHEGSIYGMLDVMMGGPEQLPVPPLKKMLGGLVSGFRGMTTVFYRGRVSTNNPYPKEWKFRVRRHLKGWQDDVVFYPEKAIIEMSVFEALERGKDATNHPIRAMNPAHIIYECLTNKIWGRGLSPLLISVPSFTAAADKLFAERFGLCLRWSRQDTVEQFVQVVIDHIAAVLYVNKTDGLIHLDLMRGVHSTAIPIFTTSSGLLTIEDDDAGAPQTLTNEIIVNYNDPVLGRPATIRVQNIASMQASLAVFSVTKDYPGIPTGELAARVAQRDLMVNGLPLRRLKLTFDRKAFNLQPGAVFAITDEVRGIFNLVLRVGRVEDDPTSSILTVLAVQDIFNLPSSSHAGVVTPVGTGETPTDLWPAEVTEASWLDKLHLTVAPAGLSPPAFASVTDGQGFMMTMGGKPLAGGIGYTIQSGVVGGVQTSYGSAPFTPVGILLNNVEPLATELEVDPLRMPLTVPLGTPVMVEKERMRVDGWNPATRMLTVSRGVGDTIPERHNAGQYVWFYYIGAGTDGQPYAETEVVQAKLLTNVVGNTLAPAAATAHTVQIEGRMLLPYPPGRVRFSYLGEFYPFTESAEVHGVPFSVGWTTRNRVTQAEHLIPHTDPNVTPEVGQTHTIRLVTPSGTVFRTVSGLTATSWDYTDAMWEADGQPLVFYVQLYSERDGLTSWRRYYMRIDMASNLPVRITVTGAYRRARSGLIRRVNILQSGVRTKQRQGTAAQGEITDAIATRNRQGSLAVAAALGTRTSQRQTSAAVGALSGGASEPLAFGLNVHEGGTTTGENTTIVSMLVARNLKTVRMDLYEFPSNPTVVHDFVSKCTAAGIKVQGILMTAAQSDNTVYTGGALTTWEETNHDDAAAIVAVYGALGVRDFELLNEIPLRSEINADVDVAGSGAGATEAEYTSKASAISIARALKGMADAVHAAGPDYRVILGTVSRAWGFLKYMRTLGVAWDVTGYHIYPWFGQTSLLTDPWFGTGGPLNQLATFGKPVTINEFNGGDIYHASYENTAGQPHTEDGFQALFDHLTDVAASPVNIESVVAYELLDETAKSAPENHFGVMYDLSTPKISLYILTLFAGGTLSSPEIAELAARSMGYTPPDDLSITTAIRDNTYLQTETDSAGAAYFVTDDPWGAAALTRGTYTGYTGTQYEQYIGIAPLIADAAAFRIQWKWPIGTTEVKSYPNISYGEQPGLQHDWTGPGGLPLLLPDGTYADPLSGPFGPTPGSILPLQLPLAPLYCSFDWEHQSAPTGYGHLSFDIWLQSSPVQAHGFTAAPITHEIMIPLNYWGDGMTPDGAGGYGDYRSRNPAWDTGIDVTIAGYLFRIFRATGFGLTGWQFVVFQPYSPHTINPGTLNLSLFINHLITRGWADSSHYCVSVSLGVEPERGTGDLVVSNFRVSDTP